tara:strand:- start:1791 stop:2141 length:351 start_codon:yes stop_codon:yes gene_type:complete
MYTSSAKMDYDSDCSETYAEFSDEILSELTENSQLESIFLFKESISNEPEFTGINNISSYEILTIFKNPKKTKAKSNLTQYQLELFKNICYEIFDNVYPDEYYNRVSEQIFSKIYV